MTIIVITIIILVIIWIVRPVSNRTIIIYQILKLLSLFIDFKPSILFLNVDSLSIETRFFFLITILHLIIITIIIKINKTIIIINIYLICLIIFTSVR